MKKLDYEKFLTGFLFVKSIMFSTTQTIAGGLAVNHNAPSVSLASGVDYCFGDGSEISGH
jgi:hypothetical protein